MTGGPLFVSSGEVSADRHYKSALERAARGDLAGAAEILLQAVELVPGFATAWFALGAIRDNLGDRYGAIAAWQKARDADPEDYHGARLQLARIGEGEAAPAMTAVYVRRLFDQHAESFDDTLITRLDYRAPAVLLEAVRSVASTPLRIGSMLDLGCGTGLGGAAFRPYVDWLVGVDVSPGMIAKARAKGLYDRLATLELQQFLSSETDARAQYHLVLAADVFVYVSDLFSVIAAAARVLTPTGLLAFTVETHRGDGAVLQQTLRYAHGAAYVRAAIAGAGLSLADLRQASTRTENGVPVAGLVAVAASPASTTSPSDPSVVTVTDRSVIPGRELKLAGPESIATGRGYGFRARRTQPSLRRLRKLG
jgi:predicted TPR repeat methyltransferase